MKQIIDTYFTTATILNWYPLLENDKFKDIIINSFRFSVKNKRANIFAFVIMNNHIHIVWQILPPLKLSQVRQNLLKYTAQQFKFALLDGNNEDENDGNTYKVVGDNTNNGIYDKQKHANVGVVTNIPNGSYKTIIDDGEKDKNLLKKFKVDKIDREYQFWKRNPLSVKITNEKVLLQKINYIHRNIFKKGGNDIDYKFSSAYYYETGNKNWDFLL